MKTYDQMTKEERKEADEFLETNAVQCDCGKHAGHEQDEGLTGISREDILFDVKEQCHLDGFQCRLTPGGWLSNHKKGD